jgi:prepilin-type N-terminal cleavage/methylation domain-containing protein
MRSLLEHEGSWWFMLRKKTSGQWVEFPAMRRQGLTLLELIVVLVILVALAGLVVPQLTGTNKQAAITATNQSMKQLQTVITNRYFVDMQSTSTIAAGVVALGPSILGLPSPNVADGTGRVVINTIGTATNYPQMHFLFVNPLSFSGSQYYANPTYIATTGIGWNGPYLMSSGGVYPDPSAVRPGDAQNQTWSHYGFTSSYGSIGDSAVFDAWGSPIVMQLPPLSSTDDATHSERYARLVSAGPDGLLATTASVHYPSLVSCGDDIVVYLFAPDLRQ